MKFFTLSALVTMIMAVPLMFRVHRRRAAPVASGEYGCGYDPADFGV